MNDKNFYIQEMNKAKAILDSNPAQKERHEALMDLCCGCVLVAEKNQELNMEFENAALMEEFIEYASELEGYDHMINKLYEVCSRMDKTVYEHPRLMARFKRLFREVVYRIEAINGRELSLSEDLSLEISELETNIWYADRGEWDNIKSIGHLKSDPIEYSEQFEAVMDEVEKELYEHFKEEPRGMGFCFGFWSKKRELLAERGIEWKTPGEMNPRVMFD